ncbi:hypothetical protein PUNSTDRAFT_62993 [Punctularia strigosozonata HHB-11173 SS5]|uniref:uncharacterized protein n=1 Tax=Punctularia strigosozonata (strain HHB-11173) TaxID=741275 RepID=UPI0004416769|nr:uncharacterized protein PUNSTDRAFT_62993 [Punctularia strigosozonata HHB-11173 SS5]EIN11942.1 hypothetical protein PUNSTDRAFT_62993 [Punctularia strigosozonata HHB-11173 SS5]
MPPFPAIGDYLKAIRESSRAVRQAFNITIEPTSIERLLLSPAFTGTFTRVSKSHGLGMPLNFPNELAELNLLAVLSLLNFGHGYRVVLHSQTGRGAWDSIRALVFSMYISGEEMLNAKSMSSVQAQTIAELMGVKTHVERAHESIPGLTVGKLGGEGYQLVKMITDVLNETGTILVQTGYRDLGQFVAETLKEGKKAAKTASEQNVDVEVVLDRIVRAIPAFRDMAIVDGHPVYCFKKALFLIHAIAVRFTTAPFPIPETSHLPVFTDNVIPSMLVHLGVIDLSTSAESLGLRRLFGGPEDADREKLKSLLAAAPDHPAGAQKQKVVPKEGPVLTTDQSYILRAAAIDACEMMIEVAPGDHEQDVKDDISWIKSMTLPDLDMWLWAVAKDRPDYRSLERFVVKDTVYF